MAANMMVVLRQILSSLAIAAAMIRISTVQLPTSERMAPNYLILFTSSSCTLFAYYCIKTQAVA